MAFIFFFFLVLGLGCVWYIFRVFWSGRDLSLKGLFAGKSSTGKQDESNASVILGGEEKKVVLKEKQQVLSLPSVKLWVISACLVGVGWWITGWWAMCLILFLAAQATPYLNVKNTQRQKNINAISTVEKLCNNVRSIMGAGVSIEVAIKEALANPTVEFKDDAAAVYEKYMLNVNSGILELQKRLKHSLGDMFCVTLAYTLNSPATGPAKESLKNISDAASELAKVEKRLMLKQKEGYSTVRNTMWICLLIMVTQTLFSDGYDAYNGMMGQLILLAIGMVIGMGVWLSIWISKGASMMRISFSVDSVGSYISK